MLNSPPKPQQRSDAVQSTTRASLDVVEQLQRMVVTVELAQHVARVVVRDAAFLGHLHRRQLALHEQLGELLRARAERPGPLGCCVIADHLEQLRPEDADHRGARPGGDDDGIAVGTLERVERRTRRPSPLRPRSRRSRRAAHSTSGPRGSRPRTPPRAAPSRRQRLCRARRGRSDRSRAATRAQGGGYPSTPALTAGRRHPLRAPRRTR